MCDFISWIELDGVNYFLTKKELRTKRGKELREYLGIPFFIDIRGHGAIDFYYSLNSAGIHRECSDLRDPKNFPDEIVQALKNGAFEGIGTSQFLLAPDVFAEYVNIQTDAKKLYQKILDEENVKYCKVTDALTKDYLKLKIISYEDYKRIKISEKMKYYEMVTAAKKDYYKTIQTEFWRLFRDPKNRSEAWK